MKFEILFKNIISSLKWRKLDFYIFKKFMSSFFFSLFLLMLIIVFFDLSENIQRFLDNNVPVNKIIFGYYLNFIPVFLNLFISLFAFISVIWFTSQLSQRNEFMSILCGGVSFYRIIYPYILGAICIAIFGLGMSNFIIPHTNKRLAAFKNTYFKKYISTTSQLHLRNSHNTYIYIEHWNIEENKGYEFTYEEIGETSTKYKLTATDFFYDFKKNKWTLLNYKKRFVDNDREHIETGASMDTVFNISVLNLTKNQEVVSSMDFIKLNNYIKEEKSNGSSLVKYYIMENSKRFAIPLGSIIMTLLGLSVASRKTNRGSGVHLFLGMGFAFSFVFLQQVSDVFSLSGGLSPIFGAWMPNIIFLIICIVLLKFTQK